MKRGVLLVLAFAYIDVLGFSLILPLLPRYAETFDASVAAIWLLLGSIALSQSIDARPLVALVTAVAANPCLPSAWRVPSVDSCREIDCLESVMKGKRHEAA